MHKCNDCENKSELCELDCVDYFINAEQTEKEKHPMLFLWKNIANNKLIQEYFFKNVRENQLSYPNNVVYKALKYCFDNFILDDAHCIAACSVITQFVGSNCAETERVYEWIPVNENEAFELIKKKYLM